MKNGKKTRFLTRPGAALAALLTALLLCLVTACPDGTEDEEKTYTVTFDSKGGSAVAAQTVKEGGKVTEPTAPTKTGSGFRGWYKDNETFESAWNFATDTVTADITLYAKWGAPVSSIAVTTPPTKTTYTVGEAFDAAGLVITATYSDGDSAAVTGYTLSPANGATVSTKGTTTVTVSYQGKTTTFTVTVNAVTYTVTFESNGGSAVTAQTVEKGGKVTVPATTPAKSGATFTGWYKEAALTNDWNFALDTVTANTTLYAGWVTLPDATVTERWTDFAGGKRFYINDSQYYNYGFSLTLGTNNNAPDTFAIQAKKVSGATNYAYGMNFSLSDDSKSYYFARMAANNGGFIIGKRVPDPEDTDKGVYTYFSGSDDNHWESSSHSVAGLGYVNTLRVTRSGAKYTVYINDAQVKEFTDDAPLTGSKIAFYVSVGAESDENFPTAPVDVRFKQLTVTP